MRLPVLCLAILLTLGTKSIAQVKQTDPVWIGAEVFIEPGQTPEEIDSWFRIMKEKRIKIARIRMFENYMRKADGTWDFSHFDLAFKAAEKYGIKIYLNYFPTTPFDDTGGFKFPRSQSHLDTIADFIKNTTLHFKQYKSLYGYVPMNEPGGALIKEELYKEKFNEWLSHQSPAYNSYGYNHFDFNDYKFAVDYTTWYLQWLVDEINKYDPGKPMHVNNHQIFHWTMQFDFPAWRKFLTSLGGSAHPSFHYTYFTRDNYAYAISANSEILRSGAGPLPWFLTEIQGGNNIYSGFHAMNPTPYEIAQWLWIPIGSGAKGGMFWCLNSRASGIEAGEWGMLDIQNQPTERLNAASDVAKVIENNDELFANAKPAPSKTFIAYTRESMWIEEKLLGNYIDTSYQARKVGGTIKSAIGYFEALSRLGLQQAFGELGEYDFNKNDYTGHTIILAHQVSIPSRHWQNLENFVSKGGKLIVTGLSSWYDENALNVHRLDFPLAKVLGGKFSEAKIKDNLINFQLSKYNLLIPSHAWEGTITPTTGTVIVGDGNYVYGIQNKFGKGSVTWIPHLFGLGARISNNYKPLADFLSKEINTQDEVQFSDFKDGLLMKTLQSGKTIITIILSKNKKAQSLALKGLGAKKGTIIYNNKAGSVANQNITIHPEGTMVIRWE